MKAERGVGHSRTQRLSGDGGIVDRRGRRKDAGKECVQRAAIIRAVARAGVRMCAAIVAMTAGTMSAGVVTASLVVTGMRNSGAGSRMGLLKRRRNNAGELGDQKEGDQKPNRARLCPEPLHDSSGCSGKRKRLWGVRPRASIP
jgi:hypothetical protein